MSPAHRPAPPPTPTPATTAYSLADAAEATFQDEVDAARFAHIRHIRQA
ncbi:hypothetical protein [Streptomyces virginiae]